MYWDVTATERRDMNLTQAESRRIRWSARIFAAWLALSVVFALTPCCDIYAAFLPDATHRAGPDHAAVSHDRTSGDDKPCDAWLDRNDALPVEFGVLPAAPTPAIAVQSTFRLPPSPVTATRQAFVASASPPDVLYLRYLRLML